MKIICDDIKLTECEALEIAKHICSKRRNIECIEFYYNKNWLYKYINRCASCHIYNPDCDKKWLDEHYKSCPFYNSYSDCPEYNKNNLIRRDMA